MATAFLLKLAGKCRLSGRRFNAFHCVSISVTLSSFPGCFVPLRFIAVKVDSGTLMGCESAKGRDDL